MTITLVEVSFALLSSGAEWQVLKPQLERRKPKHQVVQIP